MEQILTPLTAHIKIGHAVLHINIDVSFDDYNSVEAVVDSNWEHSVLDLSEDFKEFLNNCIDEYIINKQSWTITFKDSRDFVQYQLAVESGI